MSDVQVIRDELDRLYQFEIEKYVDEVNQLKQIGYKIYRNDKGEHKVMPPVRQRSANPFVDNDLASFMNGLFGSNIF